MRITLFSLLLTITSTLVGCNSHKIKTNNDLADNIHAASFQNFSLDSNSSFHGRIVDSSNGKLLAATVRISTEDGHSIEIDGEHAHVTYLKKNWCYIDGEFSLNPGFEKILVEIRRGLETFPVRDTILLNKTNSEITRDFKLHRWINMQQKKYLSGDTHVHFLSPESAHLQMRAEDLHIANLLTSDFTDDAQYFTGKLDQVSTDDHNIYVGQEIRDANMGHICLLRLQNILDPLDHYGGQGNPNILLTPRMRNARAQNAGITWAHFSNLPGSESPVAIILGLIDAVDLITYDNPMNLPSHVGPWEDSGMDQAEFTIMRGSDLYYQYLNAGIKMPIAAGSDKMSEKIPVGCNRIYVPIIGEPTYDNWLKGLQSGTGFITNGPMLTFDVSGHGSGETIEFSETKRLNIHASAKSLIPFDRLEIVVNGNPITRVTATHEKENNPAALYTAEIDTSIVVDKSSWIAARTTTMNDFNYHILPRDLSVFSHTNPVYFLQNGKAVRVLSAVNYLKTYIQGVRNWVKNQSEFELPEEKKEFLQLLNKAEEKLSQ